MEDIKDLYLFGQYIISDTVIVFKTKKELTNEEVNMLEENMPKGMKDITTIRSRNYAVANGLSNKIKNIPVNFRKENLMIIKHGNKK